MNTTEPEWQILAGKLRQELHQHGALLKMLEDQRALLINPDLQEMDDVNVKLECQCARLAELREDRESFTSSLGRQHGLPDPVTVKDLIGCFPPQSRALLEALVGEVNRLIDQTRKELTQNQALFHRAVEVGQHLLFVLQPREAGTTYTSGGVSQRTGNSRSVNYNRLA